MLYDQRSKKIWNITQKSYSIQQPTHPKLVYKITHKIWQCSIKTKSNDYKIQNFKLYANQWKIYAKIQPRKHFHTKKNSTQNKNYVFLSPKCLATKTHIYKINCFLYRLYWIKLVPVYSQNPLFHPSTLKSIITPVPKKTNPNLWRLVNKTKEKYIYTKFQLYFQVW